MISKPSKTQLKFWSKLKMAKYRRQEAVFLAEGVKVVRELFRSSWEASAVMVLEGRESRWQPVLEALPYDVATYLLTEGEWKSITQDKEPEGIMAQVPMGEPLLGRDASGHFDGHLLLAYRINNPGNLGALLRTAHWFGIRSVLISTESVDVTHPKVVRAAMGSLFHLRVLAEVDFIPVLDALKTSHVIVGTDVSHGRPPHSMARDTVLILGNESHGLPQDLKPLVDESWCIPGAGGPESLSLPQAAAIMMYELTRREIQK